MPRSPELFLKRGHATQRFTLAEGRLCVGRASANDIVLDDDHVSRHHVELSWDGDTLRMRDLGSANGSYVDGERRAEAVLAHGQQLRLGNSVLRVSFPDRDTMATTLFPVPSLEDVAPEDVLDTELNRRAEPMLLVCDDADITEHPITRDVLLIGRDEECDVVLNHPAISRFHAVIEHNGSNCTLLETGSRNGLQVNGRRTSRHRLSDGDIVQLGPYRVVFVEALTEAESDPTPDRGARRPVVLLPGFMGSELLRGNDRLWPDWTRFVLDPSVLRVDNSGEVSVGGIVQEVVIAAGFIRIDCLARLTGFLVETMGYTPGVDLLEFPYDWRRDVRQASAQLARAVEEWRDRERSIRDAPITIIGFSMGGLVARHYIEVHEGHRRVDQLITIGTPHLGAPEAVSSLTPGAQLPHVPVPHFRLLGDRMRKTIYDFESMFQLVPEYACANSAADANIVPLESDVWLPPSHRARLSLGRELRRDLQRASSVPVLSIVGYGQQTITGLSLTPDPATDGVRLRPTFSAGGDGVVPTASASLEGSDILPVRQAHGTLFVDRDVRRRLRRVLRAHPH